MLIRATSASEIAKLYAIHVWPFWSVCSTLQT